MILFNKTTTIIEFYLIGFPTTVGLKVFFFIVFLLNYIATISGNLTIIAVIWTQPQLKTPMYFFLSNLSFMEIWYTSVTIPTMLGNLICRKIRISAVGCVAQCYFFFLLGAIENYFLAVMAYDRYLAICNPLRYTSIMNNILCYKLALGCLICSLLGSLLPLYWLYNLSFCGPNQINHFFCDVSPLLSLSCTDIYTFKMYFFVMVWIIIFSCLILIIISYLHILFIILQIQSVSRKSKAFSTCGAHLTVVSIYYMSVMLIYVRSPDGHFFEFDKLVSVLYAVVTPLLNPIIYSLRNNDMTYIKVIFSVKKN